MEHHRGQRRPTNIAVQFFTRPATRGLGRVLNVSSTGAFMETQLPLRPLSLVYLEPTDPPPGEGTPGRIAATVARCTETGVGLEWCEFAAETTKVYAWLVTSNDFAHSPQLPLPTMPESPPLPRAASRYFNL
jgi:hypothetical protein